MLTIRLQRAGKTNRPEFRIVLAEKESAASKKFTEILGHYNPRTKDFAIKEDRLQYWIGQHVEISPTVHNLFVTKNLLNSPKVKAFNTPAKVVEAAVPAVESAGQETPTETPIAPATADEAPPKDSIPESPAA